MLRLVPWILALLAPSMALAHPGGLDRRGGHIDHSTGVWHSHSGGGGGGGGGSGGGGWFPVVVPVQPRKDPPSPEQRAARTAYRTAVRDNDARRRLAVAQKTAADQTAADSEEEREKRAAAKLKLAKDLLEKGRTSTAVQWLKEILKEFPETKAGQEAKALLLKQGVDLSVWFWRWRGVPGLLGAAVGIAGDL